MPLRLDVKRKFLQRSDRVKCVELHPTEPWILASLYSGHVYIWNHATLQLVKCLEVTELPVRTARFCIRKQWIVCGADDLMLRVFNYNTTEQIAAFEAHTDYLRCVAVHPTLPYVISSSDDMLIKLWDWDKEWQCTSIYEGHSHYVMQVCFNPKDTNTFASASLDRTIKVWSLGQLAPNFTLEGHTKGVNCIEYYAGGDKPYLISGADDAQAKVWDYQTKSCVQTLEGHSHNISSVCFHPELPIILTASEDGTVKMWHSTTYRLENTLNYALDRAWSIGVLKGSNSVSVGFDEGCVLFKVGKEEPLASMDQGGKVIYAKHSEVSTISVKGSSGDEYADGDTLSVTPKQLGSCDIYPQTLMHSPNGRFVVVCGDGEYVIYTALAWRNKTFGSALGFAWASDSSEYAVREAASRIRVFKNFAEKLSFQPHFSTEAIGGGTLLSLFGQGFVCFYDWQTLSLVRQIDAEVRNLFWSEGGDFVAIASTSSFYILAYNKDSVQSQVQTMQAQKHREEEEEGITDAFDLLHEIADSVQSACWAGDCFIYTTQDNRLNYCVGGEVSTLHHLDRQMFLLGYLAGQSKIYLVDKEFNVAAYTLLLSVIEFKTLVLRGETESAIGTLESIPQGEHNHLAQFLEQRDQKRDALRVAKDEDYRFDLAMQLNELMLAEEIAEKGESGTSSKWKQIGEVALSLGELSQALRSLQNAGDLSGLLLVYTSAGDAEGVARLAEDASERGMHNIAFVCLFLLHRVDECVNLLVEGARLPEAAMLARAYCPRRMPDVVSRWRNELALTNAHAADALADPEEYSNLFPENELAVEAERIVNEELKRAGLPLAHRFAEVEEGEEESPLEAARRRREGVNNVSDKFEGDVAGNAGDKVVGDDELGLEKRGGEVEIANDTGEGGTCPKDVPGKEEKDEDGGKDDETVLEESGDFVDEEDESFFDGDVNGEALHEGLGEVDDLDEWGSDVDEEAHGQV